MERVFNQTKNTIIDAIKADEEATTAFVHEVRIFLEELPADLGRGSLNGMKAQLQHKISEYLRSGN